MIDCFAIRTGPGGEPLMVVATGLEVHRALRALHATGHGSTYRVTDRLTGEVHLYRMVGSRRRSGAPLRRRPRNLYLLEGAAAAACP